MTYFKKIALSSAAIIGLAAPQAMADGFTSHHLAQEKPYESYTKHLSAEDKLELRQYINYEQREPCQFYQPVPDGFVRDGCNLERDMPKQKIAVVKTPRQPVKNMRMANVLNDYEIHFAFDSAAIEPAAGNTLDRVADEIKRYHPREVTVAGFTDTAGPNDYNIALSERRAEAVSEALNDRGITNRIIDKEAYGETKPAIETKDGVALRENRRVMVEFHK